MLVTIDAIQGAPVGVLGRELALAFSILLIASTTAEV